MYKKCSNAYCENESTEILIFDNEKELNYCKSCAVKNLVMTSITIYAVAIAIYTYLQLPLPYLWAPEESLWTRAIVLAIVLLIATVVALQNNLRISKKHMEQMQNNLQEKGGEENE